jgi:hypothetical protein
VDPAGDPAEVDGQAPGAEGYTPRPRVFRLEFAEADMAGLFIRVRAGASLRQVFEWGFGHVDGLPPREVVQVFREFADRIVEWNVLSPTGERVPATFEGLLTLDEDFVMRLIRGWRQALTGVSAPLGKASSATPPPAPPMPIPMQAS